MIRKRLAKVISEIGEKPLTVEELGNNDFLKIGINSLTFIKVVVAIEEEFEIFFDDDELNYEMFGSFESVCSIIEKKMTA
ncbi:acyl carrier protein [Clostridium sp. D2Q-14]|uniref:phosphopantetheine-binding protein n=1 Tax=Anaeromonas gelatinilytica TaxID=2683194 RepID=UPI00193B4D95|nr:phosphopantetheine-binding protein [Anaeromonas gelatinilytica]MBS4536692.1 acyl carrier protein [Anaeromonas gelatinilytica]